MTAPRGTPADSTAQDEAEAKALAASLDCFTERELQVLAKATAGTVESWRRRGHGPAYILFGNRFLYPRAAVADYLKTLVRTRTVPSAKGML